MKYILIATISLLLLFIFYDQSSADRYLDNQLYIGVSDGDIEKVRVALSKGANPNAYNDDSAVTILDYALGFRRFDIARLLINAGADVNNRGRGGTALHGAARVQNAEWVKYLLSLGAYPNTKDEYGRTPLHIAAEEGNMQIVEILLNSGANVDMQERRGRTAADFAASKRHWEIVTLLVANSLTSKDLNNLERDIPFYNSPSGSTENIEEDIYYEEKNENIILNRCSPAQIEKMKRAEFSEDELEKLCSP